MHLQFKNFDPKHDDPFVSLCARALPMADATLPEMICVHAPAFAGSPVCRFTGGSGSTLEEVDELAMESMSTAAASSGTIGGDGGLMTDDRWSRLRVHVTGVWREAGQDGAWRRGAPPGGGVIRPHATWPGCYGRIQVRREGRWVGGVQIHSPVRGGGHPQSCSPSLCGRK